MNLINDSDKSIGRINQPKEKPLIQILKQLRRIRAKSVKQKKVKSRIHKFVLPETESNTKVSLAKKLHLQPKEFNFCKVVKLSTSK